MSKQGETKQHSETKNMGNRTNKQGNTTKKPKEYESNKNQPKLTCFMKPAALNLPTSTTTKDNKETTNKEESTTTTINNTNKIETKNTLPDVPNKNNKQTKNKTNNKDKNKETNNKPTPRTKKLPTNNKETTNQPKISEYMNKQENYKIKVNLAQPKLVATKQRDKSPPKPVVNEAPTKPGPKPRGVVVKDLKLFLEQKKIERASKQAQLHRTAATSPAAYEFLATEENLGRGSPAVTKPNIIGRADQACNPDNIRPNQTWVDKKAKPN